VREVREDGAREGGHESRDAVTSKSVNISSSDFTTASRRRARANPGYDLSPGRAIDLGLR
jgi:hypothetical protein